MFFTVKELSQYLQIKPGTLYFWAAQRRIPHFKVHGLVRFRKEEIDLWLEGFRKKDPPAPLPGRLQRKGRDRQSLELLIARAKQEVYNSGCQGNRTGIAPKKGDQDGAL
jgi:excisionase family DNA binding protein